MYKRINEPLTKNGKELFAIGDTCNEIIGDSANWEKVNKTVWDLQEGDTFWMIYEYDDTSWYVWDSKNSVCITLRENGNCFLSEEEAEEVSWRRQFETKMKREFKPEECDWNDINAYKYFVRFNHNDKKLDVLLSLYMQNQGVIYCKTEEVVEQFVKDNESDLLRYFGVVK